MRNLRPITVKKIFNAAPVVKNTNISSKPIDLDTIASNGVFSLHYTITGSGTAKIEVLGSNDPNETYIETADDIGTGLTVGSGILSFSPKLTKHIKIKVTETVTTDDLAITAWLAMQ